MAYYDFEAIDYGPLDSPSVPSWAASFPPRGSVDVKLTFEDVIKTLQRDPRGVVTCKPFRGSLDSKRHQWQIKIRTVRDPKTGWDFISVYLYLLPRTGEKVVDAGGVNARFQITMLNYAGGELMDVGGITSKSCFFKENKSWYYPHFCAVKQLESFSASLLPDGRVTFRCRIWMDPLSLRQSLLDCEQRLHSAEIRMDRLTNDFEKLFRAEHDSDVTIVADSDSKEGVKIPVHLSILIAASSVFTSWVYRGIRKRRTNISIRDFDVEVVAATLEFIYTGVINAELLVNRAPDFLCISHQYCLEKLREESESVVANGLEENNALEILKLANALDCKWLRLMAARFINNHCSSELLNMTQFQEEEFWLRVYLYCCNK